MTKRERVISAINHEQTDYVPYNVGFTHQEYDKVAADISGSNYLEKIENHITDVYYCGYLSEITVSSGYWKDDLALFGTVTARIRISEFLMVLF